MVGLGKQILLRQVLQFFPEFPIFSETSDEEQNILGQDVNLLRFCGSRRMRRVMKKMKNNRWTELWEGLSMASAKAHPLDT